MSIDRLFSALFVTLCGCLGILYQAGVTWWIIIPLNIVLVITLWAYLEWARREGPE